MLGPLNMIHGSAESAPQLGRECDMTHDCNLMEHDCNTLSHMILTYGMVTTMPCYCLDIPDTWKLTPRCSPLLLSALLALLSSTPWEGTLLSSSLLFWE